MKRISAFIIVLSLLLYNMSANFAFAADENETYASIEFGTFYETNNVTKYYFEKSDDVTHLVRDGRECIRFRYAEPKISYCYIDVDNTVFKPSEGTKTRVLVDYFDEGHGTFTLRYSSRSDAFKDWSEVVKCNDTKTWKTHEFILQDADFSGRCNGYDIVLAQWSAQMERSTEDVIFGGVKIEKIAYEPVSLNFSSAEYGNIFAPDEDPIIKAELTNNTNNTVKAEISYKIYDHKGELAEEKTVAKEIGAEGGVIEIRPGVTMFGTYTMEGIFSYTDSTGEKHSQEVKQYLSIVDKFKPGERKNEDFGVCSHWHMFPTDKTADKHQTTLSELGAGWDRSEIQWSLVEKQLGTYTFPKHAEFPKYSYDKNINTLLILDYGNILYPDSLGVENTMPDTPEYVAAYANYCVKILDYYEGRIKYVELWNEVNNAQFNVKGGGIDVYANLVKTVVPIIKEKHPEVKIVGPVTINVTADWYRELFDYGVYDLFDCLSTHPYQWNRKLEKDALRQEVQALVDVCKEYGEPKPIWISEMGWSTGLYATWGVKAQERPTMAFQMYNILKGEGLAEKIFWYNFHNKGNNIYESTYNLGTVKHEGDPITPWAADDLYVMFATLNKKLGNAEPKGFIRREDETCLYHYERPDGKDVMVAWAEEKTKAVGMYLGCATLDKYDMYGNKLETINSDNGSFLISAETEPVYYEGEFSSFEERDCGFTVPAGENVVGLGENVTFSAADKSGRNVKLEAETSLNVVDENENSVTLKTPSDALGEYPVTIKAYVDGELYYHGNTTVKTDAIETHLEFKPTSSSNYNKAVLTVKNNATYTPVTGKAKLSIKGRAAPLNRPIRFVDIPAGGSMSFEISLPEMVKRRLIDITTEVELNNGYKYEKTEKCDLAMITYADKKPKIDGKISSGEWTNGWFAADTQENIVQINNWKGVNDSSFCGQLMWNEERLYIAIVAKDNVFAQSYTEASVWQGDSLQIAFCDYKHKKTAVTECTAVAVAHTPNGDQFFRSVSEYEGERGIVENAEVNINQTGGSIVYEMSVPWSEIFYEGYTPKVGDYIGFSILMNDNDGSGRRGWVEYNSGIGTGRNYTLFGKTLFVK